MVVSGEVHAYKQCISKIRIIHITAVQNLKVIKLKTMETRVS